MDTSAVTAGSSSRNASTICAAATGRRPGVLDRPSHVLVEQVDGALRESAERAVGIAAQPEEVAERQPELEETERRSGRKLGVRRRVPHLPIDHGRPIRIRRAPPPGSADAGTPLVAAKSSRSSDRWSSPTSPELRRRRPQRVERPRHASSPRTDPPDRLERQTLPLEMRGFRRIRSAWISSYRATRVPHVRAVAGGSAIGSSPNRIHRDLAGGGQLLDPGTSTTVHSTVRTRTFTLAARIATGSGLGATMRRVKLRGSRRSNLSMVLVCGRRRDTWRSARPSSTGAPRGTTTGGSTAACATPTSCPSWGPEGSSRADGCRSWTDAHRRPNNCDEYPVTHDVRDASHGVGLRRYDRGLLLHERRPPSHVFAAATAVGIRLLAGRRALWFALAPTLLIYGTINLGPRGGRVRDRWRSWRSHRRRDGWTGVLLGLGAQRRSSIRSCSWSRCSSRGSRTANRISSVQVLWWTLRHLDRREPPFAIAAPGAWFEFFRFSSGRVADFDYASGTSRAGTGTPPASRPGRVNAWSLILFIAAFGLLFLLKYRRDPDFPRWTLGFPLLACFLLFNKGCTRRSTASGCSLVRARRFPAGRWFAAFEAADVAVFVTRFRYFFRSTSRAAR